MNKLLLFSIALFSVVACQKTKQPITIYQQQPQLPVLKNKAVNHILQLNITSEDSTSPAIVKEITIEINNIKHLKNIKTASIYFNSNSADPINNNSLLFGTTSIKSTTLVFKGNQPLNFTNNYFWLSYTLNNDANGHMHKS